jgi:hypothetical protein
LSVFGPASPAGIIARPERIRPTLNYPIMKITPNNVEKIKSYAAVNFPAAEVKITGYDPATGADGILIETDELEVHQAEKLLAFRRELECHISIGNQKKLEVVVFDMLFPTPKTKY